MARLEAGKLSLDRQLSRQRKTAKALRQAAGLAVSARQIALVDSKATKGKLLLSEGRMSELDRQLAEVEGQVQSIACIFQYTIIHYNSRVLSCQP